VPEGAVARRAGVTFASQTPAETTPVASHRVLMAVDGPSTAIEGGRWSIDPLLWPGRNHLNVVDVPSTTKERGRCHIEHVGGGGGAAGKVDDVPSTTFAGLGIGGEVRR
jgi:hypothetical protein